MLPKILNCGIRRTDLSVFCFQFKTNSYIIVQNTDQDTHTDLIPVRNCSDYTEKYKATYLKDSEVMMFLFYSADTKAKFYIEHSKY